MRRRGLRPLAQTRAAQSCASNIYLNTTSTPTIEVVRAFTLAPSQPHARNVVRARRAVPLHRKAALLVKVRALERHGLEQGKVVDQIDYERSHLARAGQGEQERVDGRVVNSLDTMAYVVRTARVEGALAAAMSAMLGSTSANVLGAAMFLYLLLCHRVARVGAQRACDKHCDLHQSRGGGENICRRNDHSLHIHILVTSCAGRP